MQRNDAHSGLKQVSDSARTARQALAVLVDAARQRSGVLQRVGLSRQRLERLQPELRDCYFIRAYAVFEAILRDYWGALGKTSEPRMRELLRGVASRRRVPVDTLQDADALRELRNGLIHQGGQADAGFDLDAAVRRLNVFISYLPPQW